MIDDMLPAVLSVQVKGVTLTGLQKLLLVIAGIFTCLNAVLGLCWLLNCSWMEGRRFARQNDDDYDDYVEEP